MTLTSVGLKCQNASQYTAANLHVTITDVEEEGGVSYSICRSILSQSEVNNIIIKKNTSFVFF